MSTTSSYPEYVKRGVLQALEAAAEERDRDGDEIICPANVNGVWYHGDSEQIVIEMRSERRGHGRRFVVTVEELVGP